jgi:ribonucleotide monophosphatase NagD (HAD superfamily)
VSKISEEKFAEICEKIYLDREIICRHNPVGSAEETLLWMLLGVLVSYLSLSETETPCFNGKPTAETYRQAILFILKDRKSADFDAEKYFEKLSCEEVF